MFKFQKSALVLLLSSAVISSHVFADKDQDKQFNADASYAIGVLLGANANDLMESHKGIITYDHSKIIAGVQDVLNGKVDLASNKKIQATLQAIGQKRHEAEIKQLAEIIQKSKADGEKFQAEFSKQKDVKKTASGLLYRIEKIGEGEKINPTDIVKVHYIGKLADGTVFDSSVKRGQPAEFKLTQVIPGWIEGLQLVKKGGKITLVIPAQLAYGEQISGVIPPGSTLYFDVEVLDVKADKN